MKSLEVEAIAGGYHHDPFRVLGPHATDPSHWEVRAFLPHARELWTLLNGQAHAMKREHPHGFFRVRFDGVPRRYRLRWQDWQGAMHESEDPYRFGPLLTEFELHLHGEGTHYETYNMLGAHLQEVDGVQGVRFAVWAPNAQVVSVVGDFNGWDTRVHPMRLRDGGVWEIFLPGLGAGAHYKYFVRSRFHGYEMMKTDPYAFHAETPPLTASRVWDPEKYQWQDGEYMRNRAHRDLLREPVAIYEVHLESWLRKPDGSPPGYRELADTLIPYVKKVPH